MAVQLTTVEPLFLKVADIPLPDLPPITIVRAISNVIEPKGIHGVQKVGRLWRIYLKSAACRIQLLARKSIVIAAKMVPMYEQNPFRTNQTSPNDKKDKLTIKGLPLSVSNEEVEKMLQDNNVELATDVRFGNMRDENGALTSYLNGDRYVYCVPFDPPIPRQQKVGDFHCSVIHHGKDNMCCRSCNTQGHRAGDERCPALSEEGSILAFSGYQHPLSTHFATPILAFNQSEPFKSIEQAYWWKMASDIGNSKLAVKIRNAVHAGIVTNLIKDLDDEMKHTWEEENVHIMKQLLMIKAQSCEQFKECLIMNKDKILAASTQSRRWGTGMTKWITEHTKPSFWPGNNLLGVMLMDVSEELMIDDAETETDNLSSEEGTESEYEMQEDAKVDTEETQNKEAKDEKATAPENITNTDAKQNRVKRMRRKKSNKKKELPNDGKQPGENKAESTKTRLKHNKHNETPAKSTLDIRRFLDPCTGKRKTPETTPEKNTRYKKKGLD